MTSKKSQGLGITRSLTHDDYDAPRQRQAGYPGFCWCCGCSGGDEQMVHLGEHPEVAVCIRCAHSLSKWAWELDDRSKSGLAVKARDRFRAVRKAVMRRGWQDSPLFGGPVRWIGKRLP